MDVKEKNILDFEEAKQKIYAYHEAHNMLEFYDSDTVVIFLKEALNLYTSEESDPRTQLLIGGKRMPEIPNVTLYILVEAWQDNHCPYPAISISLLMILEPVMIDNMKIEVDDVQIIINKIRFTLRKNKPSMTNFKIDICNFQNIIISKN